MAQSQPPHTVGRQSNVSTADSGVGLPTEIDMTAAREESWPEKKHLYGDLWSYIDRKRRHWLLTRDIELARPLQLRFLAFEADVMQEIHEIERQLDIRHRERAREMGGATGIVKMSWKLYMLKVMLSSRWRRHRLRGTWKRSRLGAKRKELSEDYVRAQIGRRTQVMAEVIWFANAEGVEDSDDGAYVRDGILNYIMTGYDSIFPISRDLEVDMART
ncbi:hypothetical protein UCDDA912_g05241 [Diaporthe ampelina]|uniref:Uncharacterized protein n=1 Tax=Diaporthe ampelina TaxID=1214573 RepID=A0A0G2FL62_9PEZI|nr:hypothetical protein UCDDA912_g05241 [Diaporthe ampelina]